MPPTISAVGTVRLAVRRRDAVVTPRLQARLAWTAVVATSLASVVAVVVAPADRGGAPHWMAVRCMPSSVR
jgi:hypothetical protein